MSIATDKSVCMQYQIDKTSSILTRTIARYKAFDTFDLSPDQRLAHYERLSYLESLDEEDVERLARRYARKSATYVHNPAVSAIHRLRVNIKSLAAEARFIREEERRCGIDYFFQLNHHRRVELRRESRLAHLALAFVRGRNRREVDNLTEKCWSSYNVAVLSKQLHAKISRFYKVSEEIVDEWLRG